MSLKGRRVTVIGAGVAGLAAAQALAREGAEVLVMDQTDAIREVGAGLQISPNGAAVLKALGLEAGLHEISLRAEAVELRDGFDGDLVTRLDVGRLRPDQGWHFVHRADLINLLLDGARAAGAELRLLQKVESLDLSGPRPFMRMCTGATVEAGILIGADGLHSPLRAALNGAAEPFFTNQIAWRALVPCDPSEPRVAEVHMGPRRHLVSYPLRGGTLRNIVAVEERSRWVEEGWSLRDDPMELRIAFEKFSPRVRGWLDQIEDVWLWGLFRHPVAQNWGRALPEGMVALAGDAAHPTLPFLAQGANMALEDIWALKTALIAGAAQGGSDPWAGFGPALAAYQAARAARSTRIVAAANANARNYHLTGATRWAGHQILRLGGRLAPGLALSRFNWLYDFDVTAQQG